jgi:hypothetical protein
MFENVERVPRYVEEVLISGDSYDIWSIFD